MSKKIYVGNLSYNTTEEGLFSVFSQFGQVVSTMVIRDKFTEQSRGFGFVEMELEEAALEAMEALDGQMIDGRRVRVNAAEERGQGFRQGNRDGFSRDGSYHREGTGSRFGGKRLEGFSHNGSFRSNGGKRAGGHQEYSPRRGDTWDYSY